MLKGDCLTLQRLLLLGGSAPPALLACMSTRFLGKLIRGTSNLCRVTLLGVPVFQPKQEGCVQKGNPHLASALQ